MAGLVIDMSKRIECSHGNLERQCEMCDMAREIETLKTQHAYEKDRADGLTEAADQLREELKQLHEAMCMEMERKDEDAEEPEVYDETDGEPLMEGKNA